MDAITLYSQLVSSGVALWIDSGLLKFKQPGTLTAQTLSMMKAYRDDLIDIVCEVEERAALMLEKDEPTDEEIEESRERARLHVLANRQETKPFNWQGIEFSGELALVHYAQRIPRVVAMARFLQQRGGATFEVKKIA
jgi:hypothetical protein